MTCRIWYRGKHCKKRKLRVTDDAKMLLAAALCGAVGYVALILWFMEVV